MYIKYPAQTTQLPFRSKLGKCQIFPVIVVLDTVASSVLERYYLRSTVPLAIQIHDLSKVTNLCK